MAIDRWGAYSGTAGRSATRAEIDAGLRSYMLGVFNYMACGLLLTGIVAMLVASSPAAMSAIWGTALRWVVVFSPLAFVLVLSFGIQRLSVGATQALFWAFSAVMGLSLSTIFVVYTGASIARVFFITAGMFAATSLWGYTTKRDLTSFGSFLFMGLIGILIAGIVNIFVASSALQFAISIIGVFIFVGFTAYDTQWIKSSYNEFDGREIAAKRSIMGALSLYLNFINLFMFMLSLLGNNRQ